MSALVENTKLYTIKLVECDKTFQIEGRKLILSNVLKEMINENESTHGSEEEIPIMKCDENTFLKVIEYLDHYIEEPMNEVPKPVPQNAKVGDIVQSFYTEYIFGESIDLTTEQEKMLYNLFIISNFLDIKSLFSLCCLKTAIMMRNADREKLAKMFNNDNDNVNQTSTNSDSNMEESN